MQNDRPAFINGLELARGYYSEVIAPLLAKTHPNLPYTAALIGEGSEVLGYDSEISTDHDWGPRLQLFLHPSDLKAYSQSLAAALQDNLPDRYRDYPTVFGSTKALPGTGASHMVRLETIERFFEKYLSINVNAEMSNIDWLTVPEQKLLASTSGRVFYDGIGLQSVRDRLVYYPDSVWRYLIASAWLAIEQEEHLMGRAGSAGDELGSALIAARLVKNIMRLCFLFERQYAPYAKWYGTAFKNLSTGPELYPVLQSVLMKEDWTARQAALMQAYLLLLRAHNKAGLTEPVREILPQFHERPFIVVSMGHLSKRVAATIKDPDLKRLFEQAPLGSIDQLTDSTDLLCNSGFREALGNLYKESF